MFQKRMVQFVLLVAILLGSSPAFAGLKLINKAGSYKGKTSYWLMFVARDYAPGHAFVVWAKRSKKGRWSIRKAYGLYPKKDSKSLQLGRMARALFSQKKFALSKLLEAVPGAIKKESQKSIRSINNGLVVHVTKRVYNYVWTNTKAMRTGTVKYHILKSSCVDFTAQAARAINLKTPDTKDYKNHPQGFISKLKKLNK